MRGSGWLTGLVLVAAAVVVGCGSSGDDDESAPSTPSNTAPADGATTSAPATTTPATTAAPTTTPTTTAAPATTAASATTAATTTPATTTPVTIPAEPTTPASDGSATAVVDIGGERFEFRVIQCLRDQPSVFGDQIIDMTLDGVPPDTPDELIEPLLGVMDPDTDMLPLLEPVLEYGPALTVSRFEGGGDYLVVYDLADIEYLSDPDPLAPDGRFLEVPDGDSGITITGATTSDGSPVTVTATCP